MSDISSRIKIGVVALISMVLFMVMVLSISGISFTPQREVQVNFSFINSLEVHSPVRFAGARVGEVKRIHVLSEEERAGFPKDPPYVYVYASIDREIQMPEGTKALVNTMGFMGEKYLELMPEARSKKYLDNDKPIEGIDPTPMDSVFASAKKLSDDMQVATKNVNSIVVEMQDRLPVLIAELEKTLKSAQELTVDAKQLTGDAQKRMPELIIQMEKTLASVQDLTGDAKKLTSEAQKLTGDANSILATNRTDLEHLISNARQMTIYMKSLSHILAERPWKLVWGVSGPIPIEPEDEKYKAPASENSSSQK